MRLKYIPLLLSLGIGFMPVYALAILKSEYIQIENNFSKTDHTVLLNQLNALYPQTPEEKAFVAYYKAKLNSNPQQMSAELQKTGDTFPKTEYGQKAYMDMGIMYFLQRDIDKSESYFNKISSPSLIEKEYWMAQIHLKQIEPDKAVLSGQNYLKNASDPDKIENIYFVMANAYILQAKYYSVQALLDKLNKIPNLPKHKVYYNYLRGYSYDLAHDDNNALEYYKQIYALDRYSQFAFLTEDRLFAMKARLKGNLDISFIYPDSVYHPAPEMPDTSKTLYTSLPIPGVDPPLESVPDSIQMVKSTGHGIFLQLGRFNSELNAQNLMLHLKDDGFTAFYFSSKMDNKITYRVLMGPYKTKAQAEKIRTKLNDKTYGSIIVTR
jgi:hypothetical protein